MTLGLGTQRDELNYILLFWQDLFSQIVQTQVDFNWQKRKVEDEIWNRFCSENNGNDKRY